MLLGGEQLTGAYWTSTESSLQFDGNFAALDVPFYKNKIDVSCDQKKQVSSVRAVAKF